MLPKEYVNADGFVTLEPNANNIPGEGNGWLQTGYAAAIGEYESTPEHIAKLFADCIVHLENPAICRSPHKRFPGDENKADDYWGAFVLAKLYCPSWAQHMLDHLEENGWILNSIDPSSTDFEFRFDRFPGWVPCARIAAGEKLALWDAIQLAFTITLDIFSTAKADGNMRARCRVFLAETNLICWLPVYFWKKRNPSCGEYFPLGHPLRA